MSEEMLDGVLDVVATEEPALHDRVPTQKVETKTTKTEEPEPVKSEAEDKTKTEATAEEEEPIDEQDFSRRDPTESEEVAEPSQDSKTESTTETDKTEEAAAEDTWVPDLPTPPAFSLPAPIVNEDGIITNYDQAGYETYLVEKAKFEMRNELYVQNTETKALEAAEKILPEIKTNKGIRQLVQNTREAAILRGENLNSYEAAKQVREALGITSTKIAEAKAQGAQSAKTSITVQKNAAVETGSTKTKASNPKNDQLVKRLKQGDNDAFVELFDQWDQDGKLK